MPAGQNISFKMDPLPLPDNTPVKVEDERQNQRTQQAQRMPPGAGFMPKGGQIAYIANNMLQGWMAGRHLKAERELNRAKNDVIQSRSIYDTLADTYQKNIEAGKSKDDPEMQKMGKAITAAWNNYVNTADKYTQPDEQAQGKKKRSLGAKIGGGVKKAFMGNTEPEMFRSAAVNLLRQSGPPVLKQEPSAASKLQNAQAQDAMDTLKDKKQWSDLVAIDPSKRTPEQETKLEGLERRLFPQTTEQSVKDDILKSVMGGKQLTPEQKQLAESFGFLKPDVVNTLTWKDRDGSDYLIAIGPDGKEVGRRKLGKGYIPPDQGDVAQKIFQNQIDAMVHEYKRAYGGDPRIDPEKLDEDAHRFALMTVAGYKGLGTNPLEAQKSQFILDKAIKSVIGEDKTKKAIYGNFVVSPQDDPNGLFFYRTNVVDPQNPEVQRWWWFNTPAKYYGGVGKDELPAYEKEFRIKLRTALRKQNPRLSDEQINELMPAPIFTDNGPGAKALATDSTSKEDNSRHTMSDFPVVGGNHYRAIGPDGSVQSEDMTEAEVEAAKKDPRSRGVTFENKNGSNTFDSDYPIQGAPPF